ncbi:MAG: carbonic anhydrase [Pseudomonadota bacterium]
MTPAAPLPKYLRDRYTAWRSSDYAENSSWYRRLAEKGQSPRTMVISCCDSRVNVVDMFGGEPGELFVVRNVANLVPPHRPDHQHHGTSASVEYAVRHLKVAHIVVNGHSACGGVKACHDLCSSDTPAPAPGDYIGQWVTLLRPAYERVAHEPDRTRRLSLLEREGVITSLQNLMTFPFVADAVQAGNLTLHGTYLDIGSGTMSVYNPALGTFD